MAGSVDILQRGYTGIETRSDALWFDPALPDALDRFSMRLRYRRHLLELELTPNRLRLRSVKPGLAPIDVRVRGQRHELAGGETLVCDLRD